MSCLSPVDGGCQLREPADNLDSAVMKYTVPAIVMMLSHLCATALIESQRRSDMEIVQAWLDVQGFLIERTDQPELREEYLACQELYRLAKARAQAESDRFFSAMNWSQD